MTDTALATRHPHRIPNRAAWHLLAAGRLRPTLDRVLIRPDPVELQRPSGLWLPDTADDEHRAQTGEVLGAGPDVRDVAAGDRVLYARWGGTEVEVGGDALLMLNVRDVYALLR